METVFAFRWKLEAAPLDMGHVRRADDIRGLVEKVFAGEAQEVFVVFYLSTQNDVTGYSEVTRGTLDASLVHPREVFRGAILANASSIIVAHNHPSGDLTPSRADRDVTLKLQAAALVMGIDLLDHVITSHRGHFSFREAGLM